MRLALLLPLWLAFIVGEHSLVHSCPAHAAPVGQEQGAHAHHGTGADSQAPESRHLCTCVGACSVVSNATLVSPPTVPVGPIAFVESISAAPAVTHDASGSQLRLPFPNGPPAVPPAHTA